MENSSEKRKQEHLALCSTDEVRFRKKTALFEQVELVHRALPEMGLSDADISVEFMGARLAAPVWMSAITGGTPESVKFNRDMASLAEELKIAFCLGSMRPMLADPGRRADFEVRNVAPSIPILGNIGGAELRARGSEPILEALKRIGADGLTVHLNPAMELIQPGGQTDFKGVLESIARLVDSAPGLPLVVKETGCGFSPADAEDLKRAGVTRVETAGAGGTSWVGVETLRASGVKARIGGMLWDWGVPTAACTHWLAAMGFEVVAAGGIRNGLEVAKALSLGAKLTGVAAPVVRAYFGAENGVESVRGFFHELFEGLRAVMLLCGARRPIELKSTPKVIGAELGRWMALCEPAP